MVQRFLQDWPDLHFQKTFYELTKSVNAQHIVIIFIFVCQPFFYYCLLLYENGKSFDESKEIKF